jgi:AAA15 family ATPase/GTPase
MIPGKVRKHKDHVILAKKPSDISVLKLGILYGANASGKSNLIKSMHFARELILEGTKPDRPIQLARFRLNTKYRSKPSRFEFEIKANGNNYAYGFSCDEKKICEEWLYRISKKSEKEIFSRKPDSPISLPIADSSHENEKSFIRFLAKGTRDNQLFLTECRERNLEQNFSNNTDIIDVISWFRKLIIIFPDSRFGGISYINKQDKDFSNSLSNYLHVFDTGIDGIELKDEDFELVPQIPNEIKEKIASDIDEKTIANVVVSDRARYEIAKDVEGRVKAYRYITNHKVKNQKEFEQFEIADESDGTQRLFDLIPILHNLNRSENVFIIDEINRSLHPNLTLNFVRIFLKTSTANSQLIVTTHETGLLDLRKYRKDEIWLVEKKSDEQTILFSLEEFQPRFDKEIRKAYLLGRFGAIPKLKDFINN